MVIKYLDALVKLFAARWKVFLLSMIVQLALSSLLHFGVQAPKQLHFLMLPSNSRTATVAAPEINVLPQIIPKMETKPNQFQLKKESSFIPTAYASGSYDQAASYIVVDLNSGQVINGKNIDSQLPVASVTKIMTAVTALDLASEEEKFFVSKHAAAMIPTKIGVVEGEKMSLSELLDASLLTSANDATQVIAEGIDKKYGQSGLFVDAMNQKARILGLNESHFTNPQGFDEGHPYSSAEDLAVLSAYALDNYPQITETVKKDYQYLDANSDHKQFDLYNWNGLLGVYPGVYGIKIGNTEAAGYTTVVASERGGKKLLAVLLGAPGVEERDLWTAKLLDDSFIALGIPAANITLADLKTKYQSWRYWN